MVNKESRMITLEQIEKILNKEGIYLEEKKEKCLEGITNIWVIVGDFKSKKITDSGDQYFFKLRKGEVLDFCIEISENHQKLLDGITTAGIKSGLTYLEEIHSKNGMSLNEEKAKIFAESKKIVFDFFNSLRKANEIWQDYSLSSEQKEQKIIELFKEKDTKQ